MSPDASALRRAAAAQVFVADLEALDVGEEDRHHLGRVLRLRDGEQVVACDGEGRWLLCRYRVRRSAVLETDGPLEVEPAIRPPICVAFAPVKGERTEWTVQKLTELGLDQIVVLTTERSVVRWTGERATRGVERLRRVARKAAAQSRRTRLPEIAGPVAPATLASEGSGGSPGIPATRGEHRWSLADLGAPPPDGGTGAIAVGPEGGWSEGERALSLTRVGLGDQVLRTETAAVVAGALLAALRAGTVVPVGRGQT